MKPLRKHLKLIALFFAVTFLVSSCKVYTYKATTVDEAVKSGFAYKTKIKTHTNKSYTFIKVEKENEKIYGLVNADKKILLEQDQIKEIFIQRRDKTLSTVVPIAISAVVIVGLLLLVSQSGDGDYNWMRHLPDFPMVK